MDDAPSRQLKISGGVYAKRIAIGVTNNLIIPVAIRLRDTPVLIPNTKVKAQAADGTMLETAWESRWLPESEKRGRKAFQIYQYLLSVMRGQRKLCLLMTDKSKVSQCGEAPAPVP